MIRLFRKIRQQLLSENRYPVYLLYASGEVFLVMIGILLALQVDNWNQKRLESQRINLGLLSLAEALKEDRQSLKEGREQEIFRTYSLEYILELAGHTPIDYEISGARKIPFEETYLWEGAFPEEYNRSFINFSFYWSGIHSIMNINPQVIKEMENTGLYSNIDNQDLKRLITNYYYETEWRFTTENDRLVTRRWDDFLIINGITWVDVSNITDPLALIRDNQEAAAILTRLVQEANWRATSAEDIIEQIDVIIQLIESKQ